MPTIDHSDKINIFIFAFFATAAMRRIYFDVKMKHMSHSLAFRRLQISRSSRVDQVKAEDEEEEVEKRSGKKRITI